MFIKIKKERDRRNGIYTLPLIKGHVFYANFQNSENIKFGQKRREDD